MESFIDPTFWYKLAEIKLDIDQLNEAEKRIFGQYTNLNCTTHCNNSVDSSSFNEDFKNIQNVLRQAVKARHKTCSAADIKKECKLRFNNAKKEYDREMAMMALMQ